MCAATVNYLQDKHLEICEIKTATQRVDFLLLLITLFVYL